jgi:GTPase SAR1 family protein
MWIRSCEAYILVYSVNSRNSFAESKLFYDQIVGCLGESPVNAVLIGNKVDLATRQHKVSQEEGKKMAKLLNIPFLETSAKTGENVEEAFRLSSKNALPSEAPRKTSKKRVNPGKPSKNK